MKYTSLYINSSFMIDMEPTILRKKIPISAINGRVLDMYHLHLAARMSSENGIKTRVRYINIFI